MPSIYFSTGMRYSSTRSMTAVHTSRGGLATRSYETLQLVYSVRWGKQASPVPFTPRVPQVYYTPEYQVVNSMSPFAASARQQVLALEMLLLSAGAFVGQCGGEHRTLKFSALK